MITSHINKGCISLFPKNMWTILIILTVFAASSNAADPNIYRNCTEVDLCRQNRQLERTQRYEPILQASEIDDELSFNMKSIDGGSDLFLNISSIQGNIFRVQIEEVTSKRYYLQNVLDGDPVVIGFEEVNITENTATLVSENNKVVVTSSPFSIEFYTNDILQLVLDGDRLTLNRNELSTPFTFGVTYPQASRLYGLHEHADHLALRTTAPGGADPYRVRTMDLTFYELESTMAMYGAIPALYGHGIHSTSGLFLHNAAELWVEITNKEEGPEAYFMADSGALDLFILLGPSVTDVVKQYSSLTGVAHLPQIWTLGYHQCRWGYADQEDVQTVIADLDNYDFPVDVIWLDIQHTDNMKFFTWNPGNFSTPFEMLKNLSSTHRYLVTLSDPHFKKEVGYFVYDEGLARDFFIKNPNGTVFEDQCWPGTSVWMDYLNPEARDYYSSLYHYDNWNGTTSTLGGIWNDMNEAAIFDEPNEKTFPYDIVHYGGISNREIHNMYGYLQTMATHKGLIDRDNGTLRPFILTRAHFAGSQRYAALWTGDNTADWGYIPISYSMCLTANILGMSFCGADMGGFFNEPSEELLQRWFQAGAWLPFFREHSNLGSERREPYLYPEDVQKVIRQAIKTRYAHLPYWYKLFYEHTRNGDPVIRPLFYHYPGDPDLLEIDDQLLVGSDILVKVVAEPGASSVQMYFPGENIIWFSAQLDGSFYSGSGFYEVPVTINSIPVFYREGSIIVTKGISRPSTTDMKNDPHTLLIFLNKNGTASGTAYIDDNLSFEYRDARKYNYVSIVANFTDVTFSSIDDSDSTDFPFIFEKAVLVYPEKTTDGLIIKGYAKRIYNKTADGVTLSSIEFNGKQDFTIHLS